MMFQIGNDFAVRFASCILCKTQNAIHKAQVAFTLVEVMAATTILSLGAVLIYESFFMSMDSVNYCANYLNVASGMDEKIWDAQDKISRLGPSSQIETAGQFKSRNKKFVWGLSYNLINQDLYQIDLTLNWKQGNKKIKLLRSTYAIYESPALDLGNVEAGNK